MKKSELIDVILGYENLGEMTKEELQKHTVKELNLLKDEMDKELAEEGIVKPDAFADIPVPTSDPEPVPASDPEPVPASDPEPVEKFNSMCGFDFDPSAKSGCSLQCKKDYPDSFKECEEHFASVPDKPAGKKPSGLGMNIWYHRPSSQGAALDKMFLDGRVVTFKEIEEEGGGKKGRSYNHMQHLVADWGLDICKGQKKDSDGKMIQAYFWRDKNKKRKGDTIPGKTAYPNGMSKSHPLFKG